MYTIHTKHRKRKSILSSLFTLSCLLLLSGCSVFPMNISSMNSPTQPTPKPLRPIPTLSPAALALQREQTKARSILHGMSQDDKLAQMILVEYFNNDYTDAGLRQMVAQQHVGGVLYQPTIYGNGNFIPPCDTIDCAHAFSEQIIADDPTPPLIAIDEEGGLVDKVSQFFGASPSAEQLVQSGDPNQAYEQAKKDANELKQLGINVDLAPVVDVGPDVDPFLSRRFSADPNMVATYAGAFVKGLQANGIPATLKHFPGLGSANEDPHLLLPPVTRSMSDLQNIDFLPYQKIIQQDHPAMIMTTNVNTEALAPNQAAELSPTVIKYLRNTLNFKGVIITDGLYMKGLYNGEKPSIDQLTQVSVQAIVAGNDIIEGPAYPEQITSIITGLNNAIQQGQISQAQIDQSVMRILMMKLQYGIIK